MTLTDRAVTRLQAAASWPEFTTARFTVLGEIGRGGMGAVYLAHDDELGREVAIKVSNAVASPALQRRLHNEARVIARLEHPGIVPVHDVGRLADGRLFYVMKRVNGDTLLSRLDAMHGLAERLGVFERICDAVAFAHAHGCIHRDLKPENIMIGAFGEVLVMDWGVAKLVDLPADRLGGAHVAETGGDSATRDGTVVGTRGFMAPEQARGDAADADARADVYSLGAILFTLLTGRVPPGDPDAAAVEVRSKAAAGPRPLRAVCAQALAREPRDRYPDVRSLAADVARFRAGQPVSAYRESPLERAGRFGRTYRTPILLVLAYIIMRAIVALTAGW